MLQKSEAKGLKRSRTAVAIASMAACLFVSSALATPTTAPFSSEPRLETATCDEAIIGSGRADWRRTFTTIGRFGLPASHLRFAYRSPADGLIHSKLMVLVVGHDPVTVKVPSHLARRMGLEYGAGTEQQSAASITFSPCPDKPRTIWPGSLVFKRHEPLAVAVEDSASSPVEFLHLGRIGRIPSRPGS